MESRLPEARIPSNPSLGFMQSELPEACRILRIPETQDFQIFRKPGNREFWMIIWNSEIPDVGLSPNEHFGMVNVPSF